MLLWGVSMTHGLCGWGILITLSKWGMEGSRERWINCSFFYLCFPGDDISPQESSFKLWRGRDAGRRFDSGGQLTSGPRGFWLKSMLFFSSFSAFPGVTNLAWLPWPQWNVFTIAQSDHWIIDEVRILGEGVDRGVIKSVGRCGCFSFLPLTGTSPTLQPYTHSPCYLFFPMASIVTKVHTISQAIVQPYKGEVGFWFFLKP